MLFLRGTLCCLSQDIDPPKCRCLHVALREQLYQYTAEPPPPLPFALAPQLSLFLSLSLTPHRLRNQRSTSTEADVWLDAINKTIVWDGLLSRPALLVKHSVMNHLDRAGPSRRQTLNISPVGFPGSIPCLYFLLLFFFSSLYSTSSGVPG